MSMNDIQFALDAFALYYITDVAIANDFESATKMKLLKITAKMEKIEPTLTLNYKNIDDVLNFYCEKYGVEND